MEDDTERKVEVVITMGRGTIRVTRKKTEQRPGELKREKHGEREMRPRPKRVKVW